MKYATVAAWLVCLPVFFATAALANNAEESSSQEDFPFLNFSLPLTHYGTPLCPLDHTENTLPACLYDKGKNATTPAGNGTATQAALSAGNGTLPASALAASNGTLPSSIPPAKNATAAQDASSAVNATTAQSTPLPVIRTPQVSMAVSGRYTLGLVLDSAPEVVDEAVIATVQSAYKQWKTRVVQVAWYEKGKLKGQGILVLGESTDGTTVTITRPTDAQDSLKLERKLCFPTTPEELSGAYLQNEVIADEDFKGKQVLFESTIADIAKGAFGRPYVFFPSGGSTVTGLTCYFPTKDPNLRKIRIGSHVTVRGTVKSFLMQDVILEDCDIITVREGKKEDSVINGQQ